jgi:hypothetical protein
MNRTRWPLIAIGCVAALIGACLFVGGAVLFGAQVILRDTHGFYTSPSYRLTTGSYAVVMPDVDTDLGARPGSQIRLHQAASVRITTEARDRAVFAGIARSSDISSYLAGVAHEEFVDIRGGEVINRVVPGGALPAPPADQTFWIASSGGTGTQDLTWPVEEGRWSLVIMNLDGTAPLDVVARAGVRIEYLTPAALALLALGALCLIGAIRAFRRPGLRAIPTVPPSPPARERDVQPLVMNASIDPIPGRWLWTVKWILLVPHVLLLTGLWAAFVLTTVAAGVCVLLTQRYPRRLFDFNVGVLRWTWCVGHYGYLSLGTDRYPPFTLRPTPYPATLTVPYPQQLSRWLVLVKWLLVVPHLLIVGVVVGTNLDSDPSPYLPPVSGGLVGLLILVVAAYLTVLRRYPRGLFALLIGLNRWIFRVLAYLALMTDVYPPFRLDQGGTEPGPLPPGPERHALARALNTSRRT